MFCGVVFWSFLFVSTGQQTCTASFCPPKITNVLVLYKRYFDWYLTSENSTAAGHNATEITGLLPDVFRRSVANCCPELQVDFEKLSDDSHHTDMEILSYTINAHIGKQSLNTCVFLFPTFVNKGKTKIYRDTFSFFSLSRSGGHVVVKLEDHDKDGLHAIGEIFMSFLPGFCMMTVLAALVGTMAWFMEHRKNKLEFPSPFILGVFEGIWWSVVTMTTVGYGDKSPKSRMTRVLAFVWMILSAILLSLFTANASSLLTISRSKRNDDTFGKKIGVLHNKEFVESELGLGAYIQDYHNQSELKEALLNNKLDRILLPDYLDYLYHKSNPKYGETLLSSLQVSKVLDKPFDTALVLLNCMVDSLAFHSFTTCLDLRMYRLEKEMKWNYSGIVSEDSEDVETFSSYGVVVEIIKVAIIVLGCLVTLGVGFDIWKYIENRKINGSERSPEITVDHQETDEKPKTKLNAWFENRIFP